MLAGVNRESGVSAVLVAASLLLLMGSTAFAIDGGGLYSERRRAQNAADHAALAAAFTECTGGAVADAQQAGLEAAAANGFDNNGVSNTVIIQPLASFRYRATIATSSEATFARVLGMATLATGGTAVASCNPGAFQGEALFAGSTSCTDALLIEGEGLTVVGGTHSNNDIRITANNSTLSGGTTYAGTYTDTGNNNAVTPQTGGVSARPYPIDFQIADYQPGGSVATSAGSQYFDISVVPPAGTSWNTGNQKWTVANTSLPPGIYYSPGQIEVGANVTVAPASGGLTDGVTFVAQGRITFLDNASFTAWGGETNQGLLVFSNHPGTPSCSEVAISLQGNTNVFDGIIFAPHGVADVRGNSASSFGAVWGYKVRAQGNTFTVAGPLIGTGGDPTVVLDE